MLAPIVLFVYNRPLHTQRLLDSLEKNSLASLSDLIVYADGAREGASASQLNNILQVRSLFDRPYKFRSLSLIIRSENYGLAKSIIEGVSEVIKEHKKVIVLEDDLILSSGFLQFMNDALSTYKAEDRVKQISGHLFPLSKSIDCPFFLKLTDSWGWATWERAWQHFEPSAEKLLQKFTPAQKKEFDFQGSYNFYKMLEKCNLKQNDSWGIRWYASVFFENGLTLFPNRSLVNNMGNDDSGVHSFSTKVYDNDSLAEFIKVPLLPIIESLEARNLLIKYFYKIKIKMIPSYIISLIKKFFSKRS